MKLKIDCNKAAYICDKSQYKEASFWEKIRLSLHNIYCNFCKKHSLRNKKLTKVLKNFKLKSINSSEKEAIRNLIEKEIIK
ncbi:MAG: hypothetical protein IIB06_00445 [Bacteroidetes bacterium]|nr:hypothetical protein [Bacteroidota bacterium]